MEYDLARIDEAALALLGAFAQTDRGTHWVWKGMDFEVTNRLYERGLIESPHNKNKSIVFTDDGIAQARAAADRLFRPGP